MRLHLHFSPKEDKLFKLLRRVDWTKAMADVRRLLTEVTEACENCRELSSSLYRFRVSIPPNGIIFNHQMSMDLLWRDSMSLIQVVCMHTQFENVILIRSNPATFIWLAFIKCWSNVCIGLFNRKWGYRKLSETAELFQHLAMENVDWIATLSGRGTQRNRDRRMISCTVTPYLQSSERGPSHAG